jgi:hypothetical protein
LKSAYDDNDDNNSDNDNYACIIDDNDVDCGNNGYVDWDKNDTIDY